MKHQIIAGNAADGAPVSGVIHGVIALQQLAMSEPLPRNGAVPASPCACWATVRKL
jgi:hypothetical protein